MSKKIIIAIFIFVALPFGMSAEIGVSPAIQQIDDLQKNNEYHGNFYLSRAKSDNESYIQIKLNGNGNDYIQLEAERMLWPINNNELAVPFIITPKTAENGNYSVQFMFQPDLATDINNNNVSQVTIQEGVEATLNFSVTDKQIKKAVIYNANVYDGERDSPITLSYNLENLSNVDSHLDKIEISIVNVGDPDNSFSKTLEGNLETFSPFSQKTVYQDFTHTLKEGRYNFQADFWFNQEIIYSITNRSIEIFSPGTLNQEGEFVDFNINNTEFNAGELIKFSGNLKNTGSAKLSAVFVIEILQNDKNKNTLYSKPIDLNPGQNNEFIATTKMDKSGNYKAKAYFTYGLDNSEAKEATFKVISQSWGMEIFILIAISLLIGVIVYFKKFRNVASRQK